jgi:hypothetical protein
VSKWATREGSRANRAGGSFLFSFMIILICFQFQVPKPNSNSHFEFRFASAKISNNVIIISIVYHIIIYFPCHLFIEEINGCIRIPFLIFYFNIFN